MTHAKQNPPLGFQAQYKPNLPHPPHFQDKISKPEKILLALTNCSTSMNEQI